MPGTDHVRAAVTAMMRAAAVPGLSVAVVRHDQLLYADAFGSADLSTAASGRPFLVDGAGYGGLVGHVLDAGRFLRLHLGDGEIDGKRVLRGDTARAMRRIVATGKPFEHATGWFRRPVAGGTEQYVEHFGAGAGFWNVMRIYPERDLGIVVMTNSTTTYRFDPLFDRLTAVGAWIS